MSRRVVDTIRQMPERHRFLRGLVSWVGFRQTGVVYQRKPRSFFIPVGVRLVSLLSHAPSRLHARIVSLRYIALAAGVKPVQSIRVANLPSGLTSGKDKPILDLNT